MNRFPTANSLIRMDMVVGITATVLVLEATRRTIGASLPIVAIVFIAYGLAGRWLSAGSITGGSRSRSLSIKAISPPKASLVCR